MSRGVGGLEIKVKLGVRMPKFLFEASYTLDGRQGRPKRGRDQQA